MSKKLVIIGGGPAGYTAAIRANQLGAEVILVEKEFIGGTCLNVGCIPTKNLLESSNLWRKSRDLFGDKGTEIPWNKIFDQKEQTINQLRSGIESLLSMRKIEVIRGEGSLHPDGVEIDNGRLKQVIQADKIIIATGSSPIIPNIEGVELDGVFTSDEILNKRDYYPKSIAIVGAGVIGVEFATIFTELGIEVSIIEAESRMLPSLEQDVAKELQKKFQSQGISCYFNVQLQKIQKADKGFLKLSLSDNTNLETSAVLLSVGRKPNLKGLGLDSQGIVTEKGRIKTNEYYQTSRKHIYAVGDCSSPIMLAHVAMEEAKLAVEHALEYDGYEPINYEYVPQCVYTHPEIASVGITSEEAINRGFDVQEGVFPLSASGRALAIGETTGFIKVVTEKRYRRILGIHIIAPHATEMISEATLALTLESTTDELLGTIHPHPTISESIPEAILEINKSAIHLPPIKK